MDNLLKKIKELEREAQRLKKEEVREKMVPLTRPLLRHWSLEKHQLDFLSPLRPTAARSLQILESGLGSLPPTRERPIELEGCRSRLKVMETEIGWRLSRLRQGPGREGSLLCSASLMALAAFGQLYLALEFHLLGIAQKCRTQLSKS